MLCDIRNIVKFFSLTPSFLTLLQNTRILAQKSLLVGSDSARLGVWP